MDTYDPESGLVFTETIMHWRRDEGPWEFRSRGGRGKRNAGVIDPPPPQHRNLRSLQDLCLTKLICNANSLLPETLEGLPEPIALRIWTAIRREWRESFHVWTAFVNAGFSEQTFKHVLMLNFGEIRFDLMGTFKKLSSPGCAWVVDLTLANVILSDAEFKEVSKIKNLQNLQVQYDRGADGRYFDERIIEAWSNRVREEDAFSHLEMLSVVNVEAISADTLEHLSAFPMLSVIITAGGFPFRKTDFKKAERHGWKKTRPEDNPSGSWAGPHPASESYRHWRTPKSIRDFIESQRLTRSESTPNVPRLDAQLGGNNQRSVLTTPNHIYYFKRNPNATPRKVAENDGESARSRKRRKVKDSKGADFAAMLDGG